MFGNLLKLPPRERMRLRAACFAALSLILISYIFSNSLRDAAHSSEQSGRVSVILQAAVDPKERIEPSQFHSAVRKLAHFSEFAALGASLFGFALNLRRRRLWLPLAASAAVAVTDELLQRLSAGRGCSVWDMLLDTAGAACGAALAMLLVCLAASWKRTRAAK